MSNLRPAPDWLLPEKAALLIGAMDWAAMRPLREIGLNDADLARLAEHATDMGVSAPDAAREIIRCTLAVMDGKFR